MLTPELTAFMQHPAVKNAAPIKRSSVSPSQATEQVKAAPLEHAMLHAAPTAAKAPIKKGSLTPASAHDAISKAQGAAASQKAVFADPTYQAARGALQSQLGQYGTNLATQANRYDQQYGEDLGNLGLQDLHGQRFTYPDQGAYTWKDSLAKTGDSFAGSLTAPKAAPQMKDATFNQIDPMTSSGKAFTDQSNDYAARGMLQSSGYLTDHANLGQGFNNQLHDAQLARNNYLGDLNSQAQAYVGQTSDSLNQARIQALSNWNNQQTTNAVRAAAGLGGK